MEANTDSIVLEEEIDPNYVPSEEEVIEYAKWLGMELDKDQDLFWIAREGLMAPLPKDWKPCRTKDTEDIYYFNFSSGDSTWDHPCDGYYKRLYEEEKKKKETVIKESTDQNRSKAKSDVEKLLGKSEKKKKKKILSNVTTLSLQDVKEVQKAPSFLGILGHKPLPDISQSPRSLISNSLGSLSNIKTSSLGNKSNSLLDSKVTSSIDSDHNNRNNIENSRTIEIAPSKDVGFVNSKFLSKFEPRYEIRGGNDVTDDSKGTTSSSYGNNNQQESKYADSPDAKELPIYFTSLSIASATAAARDDYLSVPSATIKCAGSQHSSWASFEGSMSSPEEQRITSPTLINIQHIHKEVDGTTTNHHQQHTSRRSTEGSNSIGNFPEVMSLLPINTNPIEKPSLRSSDSYNSDLSQEKDYFKNKCHDLSIRIEEYESLLTKYKNSYFETNEYKVALERKYEIEQLEWKEKLRKSEIDKDKAENECRQARIAFMDLELKNQSINSEKVIELKGLKEDIKLTKSELNRSIQVHQEVLHQLEDQHKNKIDSLKLEHEKKLDENRENVTSLQLKLEQMRESYYHNRTDINYSKDIDNKEYEVSSTKYGSLLAENSSLQKRYDDVYIQLLNCRREENVLRNQIDMNKNSIENLQNTIKQLNSDLSQDNDVIRQQGDQILYNNSDTKIIIPNEENISSSSSDLDTNAMNETLAVAFNIQIENYKERLQELEQEKNNLLTQKSRQETELRHAKADLNKYASSNDADRLEKDNLKSQIEYLKIENENLMNLTSSSDTQLIQQDKKDHDLLSQELSTERSIGFQKDKKVKSYQEELLQLQRRLDEKIVSENELQRRLNEEIVSENELQRRLNEKIVSENELQRRLNEKIVSENELQRRLNEKIVSKNELQRQLEENIVSNVGHTTSECLTDNEEKIEFLVQSIKSLSADIEILRNHNEILSDSTVDLENSLTLKEREFQDFIKLNSLKIAQLESSNIHLSKQLSERSMTDVSGDEQGRSGLTTTATTTGGASAVLASVSSSMYKDLIQKKQVLEGEKVQLLVQINDLKHQLSVSQSRADNSNATILQLETERDTYKEKLIESEKTLAQIKLSEIGFEMRSDVLMNEISTLRRELDIKNKHEAADGYDAIVKECELKNNQLELYRLEIDSLKSSLNAMKSLESISSIFATKENTVLPSMNSLAPTGLNPTNISHDPFRNFSPPGNIIPQQQIIGLSLAVNQQQISMMRMEEYLMKTNKLILDLQQNNNTNTANVKEQQRRPISAPIVQSKHQEVVRNNDIESNTEVIRLLGSDNNNIQYVVASHHRNVEKEEDSSDDSSASPPHSYHKKGSKYEKQIATKTKTTNNKMKAQIPSKEKHLKNDRISKMFEMNNTLDLDNNTVRKLIQKYNVLLKPLSHRYKCKDDEKFSSQSANLVLLDIKSRVRIEYKFIKDLQAHCVAAKKAILHDQACIRNLKALWRSQEVGSTRSASICGVYTNSGEVISTDSINTITMKANKAVDTLRVTQELIKTREQKLKSIKPSIEYLENLLITKCNDNNAIHLGELIKIIEQRFADFAVELFTIFNTYHENEITEESCTHNVVDSGCNGGDGIKDNYVLDGSHLIQHISPVIAPPQQYTMYNTTSSIRKNDTQKIKSRINTITERLSKPTAVAVFSSSSDVLLQQSQQQQQSIALSSGGLLSLIRNKDTRKRILQDQINKISARQNQSQKDCEKHFGWLDSLNKEVSHMPHSYKYHRLPSSSSVAISLNNNNKQKENYFNDLLTDTHTKHQPWTSSSVVGLGCGHIIRGGYNNNIVVHCDDDYNTTTDSHNMNDCNENCGAVVLLAASKDLVNKEITYSSNNNMMRNSSLSMYDL